MYQDKSLYVQLIPHKDSKHAAGIICKICMKILLNCPA